MSAGAAGYRRIRQVVVNGNSAAQLFEVAAALRILEIWDLNTGEGATFRTLAGGGGVAQIDNTGTSNFQGSNPGAGSNKIGVYWDGAKYAIANGYAAAHTFGVVSWGPS